MNRVLLFGKLPAHGDFISRGWAPVERDALDAWLSATLAEARDALGAEFDSRYDSAPPWRFSMTLGDVQATGAFAPSQDKAGRRYPVLLALRGGAAATAERCETLLYDAIAQGWTADTVLEHASHLPHASDQDVDPCWWTLGGEGFPATTLPGSRPPALIATMLQVERVAS